MPMQSGHNLEDTRMSLDPTKPSIDERYSQAIESKDLAVVPGRCSVDFIIAAGWVQESLGTALFRLRTEWDVVRSELRLAEDHARDGTREAWRLSRMGAAAALKAKTDEDRSTASNTQENAAQLFHDVETAALTARALALAHLKTLESTKNALYAYAIGLGVRTKVYDLQRIRETTGRALQVWLDPTCPHCGGRGFNGGFREALRWCQECDRTGKRMNGTNGFRLGKTDFQHQWGRTLLSDMDRKCDRVTAAMRMFLHSSRKPDPAIGAAEHAALQARLRGLRSSEAERD